MILTPMPQNVMLLGKTFFYMPSYFSLGSLLVSLLGSKLYTMLWQSTYLSSAILVISYLVSKLWIMLF